MSVPLQDLCARIYTWGSSSQQIPRHRYRWCAGPCPRADLFHGGNKIRFPPKGVRLTATIYDMTCRLMPEFHTAANIRADESLARNVLARADRLIAISENSRQDAVRLLGLDAARIEVIYPGVPEVYFGAQGRPSEKPYVLYLGTIEPR